MITRDLNPEDFPFTILVWRPGVGPWREGLNDDAPAEWAWGVTILPPMPGTRTPLYIPSFADEGPVWVTTRSAEGAVATTGPYEAPLFGRG